MASIRQWHDRLVNALALLAGTLLVWLMLAVVMSVVMRNAGLQPPAWLFTSTEYSLFYLTLLGAPWLVRERGHVHVEVLIGRLPPAALRALSRVVMLVCAVICLVLAWKGLELALSNYRDRDYDVRTYFVPMWIFTITYPICFALMTIEFLRYVFSPACFHLIESEAS